MKIATKKITVFLFALLLICYYTGFMKNDFTIYANTENELNIQTVSLAPKQSPDNLNTAETFFINSTDQLESFIYDNEEHFDFSVPFRMSVSFIEAASGFNDKFFENNSLALKFIVTGSSANFIIEKTEIAGEELKIQVKYDKPFITMDLAYKIVIVEIDNTQFPEYNKVTIKIDFNGLPKITKRMN